MVTAIINGVKAEYFNMKKTSRGLEITYTEKFNLAFAKHEDIIKRLRKKDIECQIFINEKHKIITLWPQNYKKRFEILDILNIPENAYQFIDDLGWIVVDIPSLLLI